MSRIKLTRSEQARINGAKSRGPKTAEGRARIANARRKSKVCLVNTTLLSIESQEGFDHLAQSVRQYWQPRNAFEEAYVGEIVECTWRINRLTLALTQSTNNAIDRIRRMVEVRIAWPEAVAQAELSGSGPGGAQTLLERRISLLRANRSRLVNELRVIRGADFMGKTQEPLTGEQLRVGLWPELTQDEPENDPGVPTEPENTHPDPNA